jgi:hypothetical protein
MESVAATIQVFEHFDIPVRSATRKRGHIDDQQVPSEPMYPGWSGDEAFELPLCVDVKDEAATWRQMTAHCGKHFLPVGEAPYVVNRIEYTENHVKSAIDPKVDHILPEEF